MPEAFFFQRVTPFLRLGYRRTVGAEDLPPLADGYDASELATLLEKEYFTRCAKTRHRRMAMMRAMLRAYGRTYVVGTVLACVANACKMCAPMVLGTMVETLKAGETKLSDFWQPVLFAGLLMGFTLCLGSAFYRVMTYGAKSNAALAGMIYRKALRLSAAARRDYPPGHVINLAVSDASRVELMHWSNMDLVTCPVHILLTSVFLFRVLGPYAVIGISVLVLMMPLLARVSAHRAWHAERRAVQTDKRIAALHDTVAGMRVVKIYGWDAAFAERVDACRREELRLLRKVRHWAAVGDVAIAVGAVMAKMATFAAAYAAGQRLDAAQIAVATGLFGCLVFPIRALPMAVSRLYDGLISLNRIKAFLDASEITDCTLASSESRMSIDVVQMRNLNTVVSLASGMSADAELLRRADRGVRITEGYFSWTGTDAKAALLRGVNLAVPSGALVAVVGPVGSGKSSLVCAIMGEMLKLGGDVERPHRVAYCPQQAWIMQGTVRENILFGREYDATRFSQVVEACALARDLELLPGGDLASVGERGGTLSGGQRQRISLARAAYRGAPLVVLDDPLSALDATVGKHIFTHCIRGAMAGSTRILVTHRHDLLRDVDLVVVMDGGRIAAAGPYAELVRRGVRIASEPAPRADDEQAAETADGEQDAAPLHSPAASGPVVLVGEEERSAGGGARPVLAAYYRASGGLRFVLPVLASIAVQNVCYVASDKLMYMVVDDSLGWSRAAVLPLYVAFAGTLFCSAALNAAAVTYGTLLAARVVHGRAMAGLVAATMAFYDATPAGRIVNRMSKDVEALDLRVSEALSLLLTAGSYVAMTLATMAVCNPVLLPLVCLLAGALFFLQRFYRASSSQIKTIEALVRAPYLAQLSESLAGLSTIRAYARGRAFVKRNAELRNVLTRAVHTDILAKRWLGLRIEASIETLILLVALACFAFPRRLSGVGLFFSYMLNMMNPTNMSVRQVAELEAYLVSLERLVFYAERLPAEAPRKTDADAALGAWPARGAIVFDDVRMRYAPSLPPVLNGLSFAVRPGERIGVVGRTGAGKSSVMLALFRMVEAEAGRILVDDVDISGVGLDELRARISIIPQEPVLFAGTVRFNLDPLGRYADAELYDALDKAHLRHAAAKDALGLDAPVHEDTFSVGHRQLFCLARAILRRTRILVLDEATANVDPETDALVQAAVREHFAGCTVLAIAHRIQTVMDCDRILVLDAGRVAEFDAPKALAAKRRGIFASLLRESRAAQ